MDNGVCNHDCHTRNCSFDTSDCGNQIYVRIPHFYFSKLCRLYFQLPGYLVLILESPRDVTFSGDIVNDFIAAINRIIHAIVEIVSYKEILSTDLDDMVVSIGNSDGNNR